MATPSILSGGILSKFTSGGGILSSLPTSGILSTRMAALNTRLTTVKAAPDIPSKIQALMTPPNILGGSLAKSLGVNKNLANKNLANRETFTQQNFIPPMQPAVRNIQPTTTFILK